MEGFGCSLPGLASEPHVGEEGTAEFREGGGLVLIAYF